MNIKTCWIHITHNRILGNWKEFLVMDPVHVHCAVVCCSSFWVAFVYKLLINCLFYAFKQIV